jgi:LEA14-like dessication related protein
MLNCIRKKLSPSVLLCILLFLPSACAFLQTPPKTPDVQFVDVRLKEFKTLEAVFSVQLRVINPNDFSFIVKGANCDLSINGVHLATGVSNISTEVPASGTAILNVDIYSSVFDILKGTKSIRQKKSTYSAKGHLDLTAGHFLPLTLPIESEGDIDINELLKRY